MVDEKNKMKTSYRMLQNFKSIINKRKKNIQYLINFRNLGNLRKKILMQRRNLFKTKLNIQKTIYLAVGYNVNKASPLLFL